MALPRNDRSLITAWCFFDWANSAFTTLVVTFVYATYFTRAMAADEIHGTALWSRSVAITALVVALSAPLLGALADRGGFRRRYLAAATLLCAATTAALAFVAPGTANAVTIALVLFTLGNIGFELGNVFYFAYLPDITTPERVGRVSGYGWGLGYAGGLVCLVLALIGFVQPEQPWFGLSREAGFNVRATNILVAVWMLVFSVPLLLKARSEAATGGAGIGDAVAAIGRSFREVRRFRHDVRTRPPSARSVRPVRPGGPTVRVFDSPRAFFSEFRRPRRCRRCPRADR
jgi:UMF1 family MFS transporter